MPHEASGRMRARRGAESRTVRARGPLESLAEELDNQSAATMSCGARTNELRCHERLMSDKPSESAGECREGRRKQWDETATSEEPQLAASSKPTVNEPNANNRKLTNEFLMLRTRMSRSSGWPCQRWAPSTRLLAVGLLGVLLGALVLQAAVGQPELNQPKRRQEAAGAGSGGNSSKQLVQLMQSAHVELGRRSLQRQQRDAGQEAAPGAPTCGYPGSPAHASVTFNASHVVAGTAASYTCDNGYELLGPPRRICQTNGTWSPVGIPFCVLNVGLGKAAMQSSTAGHGSAQKAVDGSTSPYFQPNTCTMTDVEHNPWWYVNLLEPYLVQIVRIDFGTACCANRQKATIAVRVGNNRPDLGNNPLCNRYHGFIEEGKPLFLPCTRPAPGAFVSIHLESPSGSSLSICETFIYTDHALSIEQCPSFRDQPLGSTATYNGKCYLFHNNQALNFEAARKYCDSRGGTLVDETSPALQGFLSWELYRRHRNDQLMGQYWLGATRDPRNQANWKWINGRDVQISFWNSLAAQGNCSRFDGSKGWLWSDTDCQAQLNFICQYRPLSCGKPEKPTNSTLLTKNIDNGTVIEYQCAPGNLLMGPKSRVCLPTGFFSEFAPKCKYLDCQFPATIPNGDYKLLNGTTSYQSVVTYFCHEGHQLYGRPTLTCDVDERWNGPPPRCEPLLCPAPVAPSNGYVTVTSNITTPGTQATYECRPNYELVGDRLLSCLASGSWDNSFPYCREKRQVAPVLLPGAAARPAPPGLAQQPQSNGRQSGAQKPPGVQPNGLFSSNRVTASVPAQSQQTASSTPTTTSTASTTITSMPNVDSAASLPASLNGLAGQFVTPAAGGQPASPLPAAEPAAPIAPTPADQQSRRPGQPSSMNPLVQAPPPSVPPQLLAEHQADHRTPMVRPQSPMRAPQTPATASVNVNGARQQSPSSTPANKFTFGPSANQQQSSVGYDSSPLATSNSISIHSSASTTSVQPPPPTTNGPSSSPTTFSSSSASSAFSSPSSPTPTTTTTSSTSTTSGNPLAGSGGGGGPLNVLASLGAPTRAGQAQHHHSMANAKYSLDGIIAVAIFGGFIFLGAIITILVIIIRRRKKGQSSTIDAQTISTYDSNGAEHNGLYRNYQQAWENLRFATPGSQPKSSGNGPGAPPMGMKAYTTQVGGGGGVAILHHAHPAATNAPGHHQLGLGSSSTTSSSSQSSSSLAVTGAAGSGGADPLLGPHHHSSHHLHSRAAAAGGAGHSHAELLAHHHHHAYHANPLASDEEEDEDVGVDEEEEEGVISADEANYHPANRHASHQYLRQQHQLQHQLHRAHQNEGFRDSDELTINADTATPAGAAVQATRRRLYSTNSIGRSMAAANRRSSANHHQHQPGASSSGNSSNSSRRATPPADEHSLDRLAYGNNWHNHNPAGQS